MPVWQDASYGAVAPPHPGQVRVMMGGCSVSGVTPETPTLAAVAKEAASELRPTPGERSPQPKAARLRSALREVNSHPLHISSDESFETELGPLGRSMETGPLPKVPSPCHPVSLTRVPIVITGAEGLLLLNDGSVERALGDLATGNRSVCISEWIWQGCTPQWLGGCFPFSMPSLTHGSADAQHAASPP